MRITWWKGHLKGSIGYCWRTAATAPWRGVKTDVFPAVELRYLRFDGTFSTGESFQVKNVEIFQVK
jgi:hypothetical protein